MPRFVPFVVMLLSLSACADASMDFPVSKSAQAELDGVRVVTLDRTFSGKVEPVQNGFVATSLPRAPSGEYRIGSGDLISIFVFDQPELAIPTGADTMTTGFLVRSDGNLTFPFIGTVEARGRTVEELRLELVERLAEFFPDPQVDVRVASFNSQKVVIGGEVATPRTQFVQTAPLTLLEAINAAGGLTEEADTRAITVRRGGRSYRVDLEGYLSGTLTQNNPVLAGGDVVSVPKKPVREAYLLGEIARPATVDLTEAPLSLTQALSRQGGLNNLRADARGVFVFRMVDGQMTVFQLDTRSPEGYLIGTRFALRPADVVYVTRAPIQRWNDTISRLLPTLSAGEAVQDL
ncbi:MAG: hypothetical protein RIR62_1472 [Pseudomonadota bacterium]